MPIIINQLREKVENFFYYYVQVIDYETVLYNPTLDFTQLFGSG